MLTKTKTRVVTNTKILIATAVLLIAGGTAWAVAPIDYSGCVDTDAKTTFDQAQLFTKSVTKYNGGSKTDYCYTFPTKKTYLMEGACNASGRFVTWQKNCAELNYAKPGSNYQCVDGVCVGGAATGSLTIAIDGGTPFGVNLLLGAADQTLAKFKLTAGSVEDLVINQLVMSAYFKSSAIFPVLNNIRIYDDGNGAQLGQSSGFFVVSNESFGNATFSGLKFKIIKGTSKVITVQADLVSYDSLMKPELSNAAVQLAIVQDYSSAAGQQLPIQALGLASGQNLSSQNITFTADNGNAPLSTVSQGKTSQLPPNTKNDVRASEFVLYRAKVLAAWATDTPSGSSAPSAAQTIAKFVVTNLANSGSYTATVKYMNFNLSSTIVNQATSTHALKIYKDSLSTDSLAVKNFTGAFTDTDFTDSNMTDVMISSGASKTFYVTLDTTDANSYKTLSVRMPSGGVVWSDDITDNIAAGGYNLPLAYKTFTY